MDETTARDLLEKRSREYLDAKRHMETARAGLGESIVEVLKAGIPGLGPMEVTRIVPYERNEVGKIAKAGGVPPRRKPTTPKTAGE